MESRSLSGFNTPSEAGSRAISPRDSSADKRDTSKMFLPPPAELHETKAPPKTKDAPSGASSNREGQLSTRRSSAAGDNSPARRGSVASEKASGGEGQLSQRGTLSRQGSSTGRSLERRDSGRTSQSKGSGDNDGSRSSRRSQENSGGSYPSPKTEMDAERKARMAAGIREDLGNEHGMSAVAKREYLVDEFDLHSEAVYELIKVDRDKTYGFEEEKSGGQKRKTVFDRVKGVWEDFLVPPDMRPQYEEEMKAMAAEIRKEKEQAISCPFGP